jgi:hypothetical protein
LIRVYKSDGHDVIVENPACEFPRGNAGTVDLLAIAGWAAFTQQFTSAPKLFEKIASAAARRKQLAPYRAFLGTTYGFACFYCGAPAPQNTPVDHVIPWAFVAEDKVWNLVLACAFCNGQKSSSVAGIEYMTRLSDRNERLMVLP